MPRNWAESIDSKSVGHEIGGERGERKCQCFTSYTSMFLNLLR